MLLLDLLSRLPVLCILQVVLPMWLWVQVL